MKKIVCMDCKFCNRPVTLITAVGTATNVGLYDSCSMKIVRATCGHLAIANTETDEVLSQHKDLANIKLDHVVVLNGHTPPHREFNKERTRANSFEKI